MSDLTAIGQAIARLERPDPSTPPRLRAVLVDDLKFLISEFRLIQALHDQRFKAEVGTKLIAAETVPEGVVIIADTTGKVYYAGPMADIPPTISPTACIMNVNPRTLETITRAAPRKPDND